MLWWALDGLPIRAASFDRIARIDHQLMRAPQCCHALEQRSAALVDESDEPPGMAEIVALPARGMLGIV
jgi:hypothetical protein